MFVVPSCHHYEGAHTGSGASDISSWGTSGKPWASAAKSPLKERCGLGLFSAWAPLDDSGIIEHIHPGVPMSPAFSCLLWTSFINDQFSKCMGIPLASCLHQLLEPLLSSILYPGRMLLSWWWSLPSLNSVPPLWSRTFPTEPHRTLWTFRGIGGLCPFFPAVRSEGPWKGYAWGHLSFARDPGEGGQADPGDLGVGAVLPQWKPGGLGHPSCSRSAGNLEVQDLGCITSTAPSMPGSHFVPEQPLDPELAGL